MNVGLNGLTKHNIFTLQSPPRLVIDIGEEKEAFFSEDKKTKVIASSNEADKPKTDFEEIKEKVTTPDTKGSDKPLEEKTKEVPVDVQYQPLVSGMEHYKDGKYKEALEEFQKALIIFPDDPDVPFYMGLTYVQLNEPDMAIESFKKTIEKDPEYTDAHFQLGVVLIQKKAYQDAISHLENVYKKEPEREDLGYFIGFAHYQLNQYEKALHYLERSKTKDKDIESLTLYYIGLAKQQLGQAKEATVAYKQMIITDPTSPLAEPSQRLIEMIELEERIKKRFNLELTAKIQYDDNVILVPTTNVFNLRDKERKSIIELLYLRGEYFLVRKPDYDISASYGLYQTITNSMRNMDVQDHILSLDLSKRGTLGAMPYNLRLTYSYDYLLSDYHYFLQRHTIRPVFILQENQTNLSVLQYALQVKEFRETPLFPEDNRDAINHEIGFMHFLRFDEAKHHIKAGYFYDKELAQGDNWDYSGNKFVAGFQYTFPKDIRLSLDYEYKLKWSGLSVQAEAVYK